MIFISHRHPLLTIIHNFKIQFISVLTTTTVRYVLAGKGFLCNSAAVLSDIQHITVILHTKHIQTDWYASSLLCNFISLYTHPNAMTSINLQILNKLHSNRKNTVFCNMMVYSLAGIYFYFAGTSSFSSSTVEGLVEQPPDTGILYCSYHEEYCLLGCDSEISVHANQKHGFPTHTTVFF